VTGRAICTKQPGMVGGLVVTTGTGSGGPLENATNVAGSTRLVAVGAGQGESGQVMVKRGRFPGNGGMT
jgi:hypothetical protein